MPGTRRKEQHSLLTFLARFSREPNQYCTLTRTGKASIKRQLAIVASHSTEGLRASRRGKTVLWCTKLGPTRRLGDTGNYPVRKLKPGFRRPRWTEELSRRPLTHGQILAAMFGAEPFEEPRVSNQCRLIRPVTKWAERILEDIRSIKETVDGADDLIEELDERWMGLFRDTPEVRHG